MALSRRGLLGMLGVGAVAAPVAAMTNVFGAPKPTEELLTATDWLKLYKEDPAKLGLPPRQTVEEADANRCCDQCDRVDAMMKERKERVGDIKIKGESDPDATARKLAPEFRRQNELDCGLQPCDIIYGYNEDLHDGERFTMYAPFHQGDVCAINGDQLKVAHTTTGFETEMVRNRHWEVFRGIIAAGICVEGLVVRDRRKLRLATKLEANLSFDSHDGMTQSQWVDECIAMSNNESTFPGVRDFVQAYISNTSYYGNGFC